MTTETLLSLAALLVSVLAAIISGIALYKSLFHRGSVRMTQPTPVLFSRGGRGLPRVSMVTMLFTTGSQGHVIESMYLVLHRGSTRLTFPQWSYLEGAKAGSAGLHVPSAGISMNHEFVGAPDSSDFQFTPGQYVLEVYATLLTSKEGVVRLDQSSFTLPTDIPVQDFEGVMFTWLPSERRYAAEPSSFSPMAQ